MRSRPPARARGAPRKEFRLPSRPSRPRRDSLSRRLVRAPPTALYYRCGRRSSDAGFPICVPRPVRLEGVARMLIASLLVCLACVSLVGNATAQLTPSEIPNFPPPAMQRQCPRTSSDVKFMAPNIPSNAPCKPFSADSPYCDPPPCYSGATDPLGFPQGGCHGKDENGRVSAARQPSRPPRCVTACRDSRS